MGSAIARVTTQNRSTSRSHDPRGLTIPIGGISVSALGAWCYTEKLTELRSHGPRGYALHPSNSGESPNGLHSTDLIVPSIRIDRIHDLAHVSKGGGRWNVEKGRCESAPYNCPSANPALSESVLGALQRIMSRRSSQAWLANQWAKADVEKVVRPRKHSKGESRVFNTASRRGKWKPQLIEHHCSIQIPRVRKFRIRIFQLFDVEATYNCSPWMIGF